MSRENVEVVRRVTDVMDAEGFEAALPIFLDAAHPDVEWREDPAWPGSANDGPGAGDHKGPVPPRPRRSPCRGGAAGVGGGECR
jgi:hypothetical protein